MVRLARALARGLDDALTPAGVRLFLGALLVVSTVQLLVNTLLDGVWVALPGGGRLVVGYVATLPLGREAAAWALAATWLGGSWLLVVLVRTLARDTDDQIHPGDVTREALPATLRVAVATAAGAALTLVGLAFGLAPGVLVAGHALFVPVVVAVEDAGLVTAVGRSWTLAAAHRVRMLALVSGALALLAAAAGVGLLSDALAPWLEFVLGVGAATLLGFVTVGSAVDIYRQHGTDAGARSSARDSRAGAL
jgi:hypothetical protein